MDEKLCPECLAPLVLHKSSFEQYQPSVYSCDKCKHDFAPPYVEAFMKGFSRRPELDEKSVYQEIVNQSRPPYEQWERILARRICAKFRAPDSSNEQAYEWGYADGKKSVGQPASSVNAELDEDKLKLFLYSQRDDRDRSKGVDFKVALQCQHLAKAICAKFTAPEAKQGLSVEEIKQIIWSHGYGYETSPKLEECAQEIHGAQPASSVNAQVVEALEALLVAVCYKTPTVDFGTKKEPNPCYEARVPVQFVHDAHKALNSIKAGKDTKCS